METVFEKTFIVNNGTIGVLGELLEDGKCVFTYEGDGGEIIDFPRLEFRLFKAHFRRRGWDRTCRLFLERRHSHAA